MPPIPKKVPLSMIGLLIKTLKSAEKQEGKSQKMTIVLRRPHGYLEQALADAFAGQAGAEIVVDRRRDGNDALFNFGQSDRRQGKEDIIEIILS